jgi:DNA-binding NarL/FixJ family response regulator
VNTTLIATTSESYAEQIMKYVHKDRPFEEVVWAGNRREFIRLLEMKPRLILLESNFLSAATAYCILNLTERNKKMRIAVVGYEEVSEYSRDRFYAAGIAGYVDFRGRREDYTEAMNALVCGKEEGCKQFIDGKMRAKGFNAERPGICRREMEVCLVAAAGKSNKEAGDILGITEKSVRNYKTAFYLKTGIRNNMELLLFFAKTGWVDVYIEDNRLVVKQGLSMADMVV